MIIKNILRGLSPSAPRPDVMYDGGIIMKKRRTKEIKQQAKMALQGHLGTVILGLLAVYGLNMGNDPVYNAVLRNFSA